MSFPRYIRTKAEALALAADLFPDHRAALARVKQAHPEPDDYPFYWVESHARDDLRRLFDWLFDDKTRIYKRPRWHLFYDLAHRLTRLIDENREAQERYWSRKFSDRDFEKRQRAQIMAGDGEGI